MNSNIIIDCLNDYQNVQNVPVVVNGVIPILWFGDEDAYRKSNLRIVTVGKNPSFKEFEENSQTKGIGVRFSNISSSSPSIADYKKAMNSYFHNNPFKKWFTPIEQALNSIDATLGGKMCNKQFVNTAIHIDYYAPVATKPIWSNLCPLCINALTNCFSKYFQLLIDDLQPDIMIMFGNAGNEFVKQNISSNFKNQTVYKTPKGIEYFLSRYDYCLGNKIVKIVTTPYWSIPFSPYKIAQVQKDLPQLI